MKKVSQVVLVAAGIACAVAGIAGAAMRVGTLVAEGREFTSLLSVVVALVGIFLFAIGAFFFITGEFSEMEKRQGQEVPEDE